MTVSSTSRLAGPFVGTGSNANLAFTFYTPEAAAVRVSRLAADGTETVLTPTTHYTVTLNADQDANPGGTVAILAAAYTSGLNHFVTSDASIVQSRAFRTETGLNLTAVERGFDLLTTIAQEHDSQIARAPLVPIGETAPAFPKLSQRIDGALLGFGASGALKVWDIGTANLLTIVGLADEILAVSAAVDDINDVLAISGNIATVAGLAGDVTTVAGISGSITTVAGIAANIGTVAANNANITSVAGAVGNVNSVAGALSTINSVAGALGNINTVAGIAGAVSTAASNMAAIVAAPGAAASAAASADTATNAANQAVAAVGNFQTFKTLVDVAPTVPLTAQSGTPVIDGVQTVAGMRVLDWNNPDATKRGVYVVAAGAWSRAADADTAAKISGMSCVVARGDTHFGRQFNCVTGVNTLGTDLIDYVPEFSGATELTARARQAFGAYIIYGDSNTVGRNGTHQAYQRGRGQPHQGPWRDWQHYHLADSGFKLHALAQSIAAGDRNAFPTNGLYKPNSPPGTGFGSPPPSGGGGNIYLGVNAANAHPNSIIEICLGTNDFGLAPRSDGSGGTFAQFKKNMQEVVSFLLAVTKAHIVLRIPQPFGGIDFIQGTNVTQWASDSPDATAAGGAAARSAEMIAVYRQWVGRNPRVSVFDAPRLVYGADRCDDHNVNCMDLQIPANYKGKTITTAQRALISDSLHASDLGKEREEEALMQFYGLSSGRPHVDHNLFLGPMFPDWENIVEGEWFYFEAMTNSGADTSFRVRPSPENLAWGADLFSVLTDSVNVYGPRHELMREGERMLLMKRLGALKRMIAWRKEVKFFFPASGNTYTASDISYSSTVTDSDPFASKYVIMFAKNVNMGAELAAAQGPDIGVTGIPAQDKSRQRVLVYVTEFDSLPEIRRPVGITVVGTLGCSPDPYNDAAGESWVARTFRCVRTDNSPTTPTITLSIFNLSDGRLVDGSVNFGTGEGMPIGTFTFSSGVRTGTWAPNTANIDAAIAAGIGWKGVAGSNWVTMKFGYGFRAKVDSALGNPAQITISN